MPITGHCAWKERGLSPSERIDRFFNLIDHAVENGIPLNELYSREHVKTFMLFVLKEQGVKMISLTLKSNISSPLVIGDPAYFTARIGPKETVILKVPEEKFERLNPVLESLKKNGWLSYEVNDATKVVASPAPTPAPKAEVPPPPPPAPAVEAPPAPVVVTPEPTVAPTPSPLEKRKRY